MGGNIVQDDTVHLPKRASLDCVERQREITVGRGFEGREALSAHCRYIYGVLIRWPERLTLLVGRRVRH